MTTSATETETASVEASPPARRRIPRRFLIIGAVVVIALVAFGANLYVQSQRYVSTDNAQVTGQLLPVGSTNAGRVAEMRVAVGSVVHQGDVLAMIELPSVVRTLQNGTPDLEFLGAADQVIPIVSPANGVVATVPGTVGASTSPGQPLVTLVDPGQLWVTANIDENKLGRLKVGQGANVHVDALNTDVTGTVESLTPATAGAFALLPQSNTTTNFTKVAQVVPVRVRVQLPAGPGLLGSSAEVKIRVTQ